MLLTIATTHRPATDLGTLLHKHPDRVQAFDLNFGRVIVAYREVSDERCAACLLLDVDPVGLVRDRDEAFALGKYVNDRPYAVKFLPIGSEHVTLGPTQMLYATISRRISTASRRPMATRFAVTSPRGPGSGEVRRFP